MQTYDFDGEWLFRKGECEGGQEVDYDDCGWLRLTLPHDWSIEGPFDPDMEGGMRNGFFPLGTGWYRKRFTLPELPESARLWIDFDGAYRESDVWINGIHVGRHTNGYIGFSCDITPYIDRAGANVMAVRCGNNVPLTSRWYTGSGIYRHVRLRAGDPVHVPKFGTYVTTPVVELDRAVVQVETKVRNEEAAERYVTVETTVWDAEEKRVAAAIARAPVRAGAEYAFVQSLPVTGPSLWSPDSPHLYTVRTLVLTAEEERDRCETVFGIRRVEFTPEQGFLLNGTKTFLKGVNLHHELGCLGAAAFDAAIERRLRLFKEMGCNAVRLSHNPHAPYVLDLCDRLGILVYNEAFDKLTGQFNGYEAAFEDTWRRDLKAFIDRDRNHPCVFVWSVGNEPVEAQLGDPEYGVRLVREMVAFTKNCDPSREVTCALFPSRAGGARYYNADFKDSEPPELAFHTDVASYNYRQDFFRKDHEKYPQLKLLLSEAAVNAELGGWFDYGKERIAGHFFWGGTDYFGESFGWPCKGWFKGLVDLCGYRKPISYYMESIYSEKPMVHIAVYDPSPESGTYWNDVLLSWKGMESHWNWGEAGTVRLATYTNCDAVELSLNGRPLGVKLADCERMLMEWELPYEPGVLEAVAFKNGRIAAVHRLRTAGEPKRIVLVPDKEVLAADSQDLSHVAVLVTDEEGNVVPGAAHWIRFRVDGEGASAGVCSGDLLSEEAYRGDARSAYRGVAQIVLRSGSSPGWIGLEATANGLRGDAVRIRTVKA